MPSPASVIVRVEHLDRIADDRASRRAFFMLVTDSGSNSDIASSTCLTRVSICSGGMRSWRACVQTPAVAFANARAPTHRGHTAQRQRQRRAVSRPHPDRAHVPGVQHRSRLAVPKRQQMMLVPGSNGWRAGRQSPSHDHNRAFPAAAQDNSRNDDRRSLAVRYRTAPATSPASR